MRDLHLLRFYSGLARQARVSLAGRILRLVGEQPGVSLEEVWHKVHSPGSRSKRDRLLFNRYLADLIRLGFVVCKGTGKPNDQRRLFVGRRWLL